MAAQRRSRRIARLAARFALAAAATVLAVGLGEVAVRLLGLAPDVRAIWVSSRQGAYKRSSNHILSYELKANYRNDRPDFRLTYERTNSHGLRDRERSLEKPPGGRRVILLGDSIVEGHGIREADTISRQLERLYADGKTEVLNFGVSGYCTLAEIEMLEVKGVFFGPDQVVLVFVQNDFDNFNEDTLPLGGTIGRPAWSKRLFIGSHLFRLLAIRLNLFHFGVDADPVRWNKEATGNNNVVDGLRRFRELAARHGFDPLVAVWPEFGDTRIADLHFVPGGSEQLVIERLAKMYGLPSVRLSGSFRRDLASRSGGGNPRLLYTIGDGFHPSARGAGVAAEAIKAILARLGKGRYAMTDGGQADTEAVAAAAALGSRQPNYAGMFNNLAEESLAAGKLDDAVAYLTKAIEADPENPSVLARAHNNLGIVHRMKKEWSLAAEEFAEALRHEPDTALIHHNLAEAFFNQGDLARAKSSCRRAVRIQPNYAPAQYLLGSLLHKEGKLDQAAGHYQQAVLARPGFARAHFDLGRVFAAKSDFVQAAKHYRRALEARPDWAEAHNRLGVALQFLGKLPEAEQQYRRAIQLAPGLAEAYSNLGIVLDMRGRPEQARKQFNRAIEVSPDYHEAHYNLGVLSMRTRNIDQATIHFRRAVRVKPDYAEAHYGLAQSLEGQADLAQAGRHYERVVALRPRHVAALNSLARLLATRGDPEPPEARRAVELATRAAKLSGYKHPGVLDTLAAACAAAGQFDGAVRWQIEAIEKARDADKAAYRRRLELYKAGKPYRSSPGRRP